VQTGDLNKYDTIWLGGKISKTKRREEGGGGDGDGMTGCWSRVDGYLSGCGLGLGELGWDANRGRGGEGCMDGWWVGLSVVRKRSSI
jgi:hypothetical protein